LYLFHTNLFFLLAGGTEAGMGVSTISTSESESAITSGSSSVPFPAPPSRECWRGILKNII